MFCYNNIIYKVLINRELGFREDVIHIEDCEIDRKKYRLFIADDEYVATREI